MSQKQHLSVRYYSKNPHIRTCWFKNLPAEIWHSNTQKYKNLFSLAIKETVGSYTKNHWGSNFDRQNSGF